MKNIITITRLNDKARRIYELPETVTVDKDTLVQVETRYGDRLYGIATTASALMDDTTVAIIRATLGMNETGDFLKVKAVYGEPETLEDGSTLYTDGYGIDPDDTEEEVD